MNHANPFGKVRNFFFPIHRSELAAFLPLMGLMVLICFNYTLLRTTKESLIVTSSGAEAIPFIKVWVVLPTAMLLTLLFAKLVNLFGQEKVFYIMISLFLLCYALFIFCFFPYRHQIHLHSLADWLELWLPAGFQGLISAVRHWSFTGFYVMCELWSSMIMTTLFWGFANEITPLPQARRFYSVLAIFGNLAALGAGAVSDLLIRWCTSHDYLSQGQVEEHILRSIVMTVVIVGLLAMALFFWMNRTLLKGASYETLHLNKKALEAKWRSKRKKSSLRDSFSYLSNSRYLLCIATIVVAYNLVINLSEIVWKDKLRLLYPHFVDYQGYMNSITIATSCFSTITAFFMAKIITSIGWTRTALLTPVVMGLTTIGFFGFLFFQDFLSDGVPIVLGTTPLTIAVFFGGLQNSLSRAAKYSVFDATKEMAFIPLDHETKLKGKAAIDGVGSRLGKSGGSFLYQLLLLASSGVTQSISSYVALILFGAIILWIFAVRELGTKFDLLDESGKPPRPPKKEADLQLQPGSKTTSLPLQEELPEWQSHPASA